MQNMDKQQQFDDLIKAAITLFIMSGEESYRATITHKENPELRPSEIVVLTIIRKHRLDLSSPMFEVKVAV